MNNDHNRSPGILNKAWLPLFLNPSSVSTLALKWAQCCFSNWGPGTPRVPPVASKWTLPAPWVSIHSISLQKQASQFSQCVAVCMTFIIDWLLLWSLSCSYPTWPQGGISALHHEVKTVGIIGEVYLSSLVTRAVPTLNNHLSIVFISLLLLLHCMAQNLSEF